MKTDAEEMVEMERRNRERMSDLMVMAASNALAVFLGVTLGLYVLWTWTQPAKPVQHYTEQQIEAMK